MSVPTSHLFDVSYSIDDLLFSLERVHMEVYLIRI